MEKVIIKNCTLYNMDCMEYMKSLPDNAFNLAIVDPPYGIKDFQSKRNTPGRGVQKFQKDWKGLKWDMKPKKEYFDELFRISKNQIIWGANNFILPTTEYFCIWDKQQTVDNFASAEYAWISSNEWKKPAKVFTYSIHQANALKDKIHPTQKPVKLYEWLLSNYAKQGDKILDTHLGSGSHAIACNNLGFELVGLELDSDYFKASCERIAKKAQQERLF